MTFPGKATKTAKRKSKYTILRRSGGGGERKEKSRKSKTSNPLSNVPELRKALPAIPITGGLVAWYFAGARDVPRVVPTASLLPGGAFGGCAIAY